MGSPKYKNGFDFTLHPSLTQLPLSWRKPSTIFVSSMSDFFHEKMPYDFFEECMNTMEKTPQHIYQILTKRPERMLEFSQRYGKVPDHVWLGTSVELAAYKPRIDVLRKVDCKVRFLSCEPLLGPLGQINLEGISQVIVGGESGPNFRPMQADWAREIRDQCIQKKVAFSFKQWAGTSPKSAGRELDGRIWDEYP